MLTAGLDPERGDRGWGDLSSGYPDRVIAATPGHVPEDTVTSGPASAQPDLIKPLVDGLNVDRAVISTLEPRAGVA
ncbi:hypothetical protein N1028_15750 [Herbiconiux sp. CPCC 203407]|uniref:Uncharacterized protein n=1 Tax=Herbiconiux oxytropis TaxID=2970915 RepID=A0AA41XIV1_9MICO|nr:hypothetical protein [Herbiconiux oxytropis]MCS5721823.1 hypothetical protein [Herbiconiux oxytropis]MCS5727349.1 hypothetical protein [Herbiconiux oxytropis]